MSFNPDICGMFQIPFKILENLSYILGNYYGGSFTVGYGSHKSLDRSNRTAIIDEKNYNY